MTEKVEERPKTKEEIAKEQEDLAIFAKGKTIGTLFKRRHPEFIPCRRNAESLHRELTKRSLEYSLANLETVYQDLLEKNPDMFNWEGEDSRPEIKEPVPPVEEAPPAPLQYPWGLELTVANDGKARVKAMSAQELSAYMRDRRIVELEDGTTATWGDIFKQQVGDLKVEIKQLQKENV